MVSPKVSLNKKSSTIDYCWCFRNPIPNHRLYVQKPWLIYKIFTKPQLMACPPDVPINRIGNHTKRTAKKPKGVVVHSAKRCTQGEVTVLLTSLSEPDWNALSHGRWLFLWIQLGNTNRIHVYIYIYILYYMHIWLCIYVHVYMVHLHDTYDWFYGTCFFWVNIPKTLMRNGSILHSVYTIVYTGCIFCPEDRKEHARFSGWACPNSPKKDVMSYMSYPGWWLENLGWGSIYGCFRK